MNSAPHEVVAAPFTLWWKPVVAGVSTVFPALHVDPATAGWTKIGSNGNLNYDRSEAVTAQHRQTVVPWRSAGDTGVRKNFRTEEDQLVRMKLVDITLAQYRLALNHNAITSAAPATPALGQRKLGLSRGSDITTIALLVRADVSPYQLEGVMQYEIPLAQEVGSPDVALGKPGEPSGLMLEFSSLVDVDAASTDERFGRLVMQDDDAEDDT